MKMNNMTQEEKAKRYDEAIERAKEQLDEAKVFDYKEEQIAHDIRTTTYAIFPELKEESEDERIRQLLLRFVKYDMSDNYSDDFSKEDCLAWLEKQGEQKPDTNCLLSWSEIDEKMLQSLEGIVKDYWAKAEQEKNEIKIREASNVSYFLKTIQKSPLCWIKCSDELPNRDGTYLVVTDGRHNDVYDIAMYDSIEGWHKASDIIYWMPIPQLNNKSIIEQKPADKVEPKFKVGDKIKLAREPKYPAREIIAIQDDAYYFDEVVYLPFSRQDEWELVEQKPAWSEEDKDVLEDIEEAIINYWHGDTQDILLARLKSLRPQNRWKPSDEQMEILNMVLSNEAMDDNVARVLRDIREQLKKLREE